MISIIEIASFSFPDNNKEKNEDWLLPPTFDSNYGLVLAIADGVGSSKSPNQASLSAIKSVKKSIECGMFSVKNAFDKAKEEINKLEIDSATTLTVVHISEGKTTIGHLGDCRVYAKINDKLNQLTIDHNKYKEMFDSGEHKLKNLKNHKERLSAILTKALSKNVSIEPDILTFDTNDFLFNKELNIFIMSDGAYKHWEKRPRFSKNTMDSPLYFASSLKKRILKEIVDDYSFIGVKVSVNK